MAENNERWLIDGDCSKCRRQKHCSKPCRRAKNRQQAAIMGMLTSAMIDVVYRK